MEHGNDDQSTTPYSRYTCKPPTDLYYERNRARKLRPRMRLARRKRGADEVEEERSVARTLTYEDSDQSPSTSQSRPSTPVRKVVLDYQIELRESSSPEPEKNLSWQNGDSAMIASRLISHARESPCMDDRAISCLSCGKLPLMPVTSSCGHTRCQACVQESVICTCGISHTPWLLNVNVMVQGITQKIQSSEPDLRQWMLTSEDEAGARGGAASTPSVIEREQEAGPSADDGISRGDDGNGEEAAGGPEQNEMKDKELFRMPITPQDRLDYASLLTREGKFMEAAPHLARLAISTGANALTARKMLVEAISELSKEGDISEVEKQLCDAISAQGTTKWLSPGDLECVFCCDTLNDPVTTPCGHTFCRQCLERSLDYRSTCALCMQVMINFNLQEVCVTEIVRAALEGIGAIKPPEPRDPNLLPILTCSGPITFPGVPCPLYLFEPRYRYMVRRIMESDCRRFGLVAQERESGEVSDFGTILEVHNCILLPDGCAVISTIGISRFKVIARDTYDGWCDVARVSPITDIPIVSNDIVEGLRVLARHISFKVALWLNCFSIQTREKIQRRFGAMPYIDIQGDWWRTSDGPVWLWWIISTLPLSMEIRVLMLSTDCLLKRMRAVLRTLDSCLAQTRFSLVEYELTLKEWWDQRPL
ncbi:LON peptidase N-terminal domain and RING finger protein 1 isoform X2 [Plodia interpunctella]|uniref:LON peptidase N-terminal domain and RING finger protein 1 isoform X2 n=1 Tax=Plodia interpunctella TaxID=58824 RepID=UPI00236814B0|nr:LON peptidase N-terminal domain and RING finger protein 1 isoform X2 [Plodia interpunctella]